MVGMNYRSIVVAAFAAFVMSSLYYSPPLLGNVLRAVDRVARSMTFSPWKLLVEIPRTVAVAFVMAHLLTMLGANDVRSAAKFALWLWFGFSALMWVGAVTWEQNPWQVAAIHSGDWLLKIVLIVVILFAWRKGRRGLSRFSSRELSERPI
jgi:hypothetical protein